MHQPVMLASVATAVPPFVLKQRDVAAAAHRGFAGRYRDFERVAGCSRLRHLPALCGAPD